MFRQYIEKFRPFFIAHKVKVIGGVVLLIALAWFFWGGSKKDGEEVYTVSESTITEEVAVTGRVKSIDDIKMAFEKSGRVARVFKEAGDKVYAGEVIAQLELGSPLAKLNQERAKLEQLKRGSRSEEINVKKATVAEALRDLDEEYSNVYDVLNDALVDSDDAVRVKTSNVFSGNSASGYKLTFPACDTQLEVNVGSLRAKSEAEIEKWKIDLAAISGLSDDETLDNILLKEQNRLYIFRDLLETTQSLLNQSCVLGDSSLSTHRTNVSTARNNLASAILSISEKISDIKKSKAALLVAESNLNLLLAGSDPEDIKVQEAVVLDAEAELAKYRLVSPINGIVSKQDATIGEIAYADSELVSLISDSGFEIEIDVPELDIPRIKKENSARVTLDAYGEGVFFAAVVSSVDPAETIIENVPKYQVTLLFTDKDERIKSGLTANVYIITNTRNNALSVPSRAVLSKAGKKYIIVKAGNSTEEREVILGIRGNKGEVEVVSGLSAGEIIIISNASSPR